MLWLLVGAALASDPAALRQLHGTAIVAADIGPEALSVAADVGPAVSVTFAPGAWLGGAVGTSTTLLGEDRPWGVDATVAGGAAALLATPGVALTGTGALRAGRRGERTQLTGSLVVPAAVRLDWPVQAVLPADLELAAGLRAGRVWIGARGWAGAGLAPGHPPALRTGWAVWARLVGRAGQPTDPTPGG